MAKGFSLSIAADTRSFTTAVKRGIQEPLEDAADILEDIGRDGGRDIGEVEDAARDAQKDTEKLKDEYRNLQQEIRDTGRKAKTDFADPSNRASRDVQADLEEVNREAKANAAEMFSSFDGSFESIADAAQGTLGGLVGGLGGIAPIAAVAAGAAGIGLISAEIIKQQEQAEELKRALTDAYAAAAEAGRTYLDEAQIVSNVHDLLFNEERTGELERYRTEAEKLGVDWNTYLRAMSGDADALSFSLEQANEKTAELNTTVETTSGRTISTLTEEGREVRRLRDSLGELSEQHQKNEQSADEYLAFVETSNQREREQIVRTRSAEQERWNALAERVNQAQGQSVNIPVNVDTAPADAALRRWFENPRNIRVNIDARDFAGRRVV